MIDAPDANDYSGIELTTSTPIDGDMGGCSGKISGGATLDKKGGTLYVANEDYDPADADSPLASDEFCEIALSFKDGQLLLQEGSGCLTYRGAACGFTG